MTEPAFITLDVLTTMIAVATVLAVLVVALATLTRPSKATITWGAAFLAGMLAAYFWFASQLVDSPALHALASGVLLGFIPLIWLGLRFYAHRSVLAWLVVVWVLIVPVALTLTAGTAAYQIAFHLGFLAAAVFAGLLIYELSRLSPDLRAAGMPLAFASGSFLVVAVVAAVTASFTSPATLDAHVGAVRSVTTIGMLMLATCAAFTVVLLARSEAPRHRSTAGCGIVAQRIARAQTHGDRNWSVLDIRLDDPRELDDALSGSDFAQLIERFHADIVSVLPVSADIEWYEGSGALVAIRDTDDGIRHHVRTLLHRISMIGTGDLDSGIRVSASIGWASISRNGSEYSDLSAAAGQAAAAARAQGGDTWVRASGVDQRRAEHSSSERTTTLEE